MDPVKQTKPKQVLDSTCTLYFVIVWDAFPWLGLAAASYPPVIGVLPALMDGVWTTLLLCQLPLFVHVGSPYQFDSQTEILILGQTQSF